MATSDETKNSYCSPCLDDGRNTTSRHYCLDCEMYFCTKCVKCHNRIPSLKTHKVNDVNSSDSIASDDDTKTRGIESVDNLRCTLHGGKVIDTYCKDHDEVCCRACTVVKHRSCITLPIYIAAKDFKTSPELNKYKEVLTETMGTFTAEKEKRKGNIDCIGKQKVELIETVDKYEKNIIAKMKELANISRKEIRTKYEEHKTSLEMDIEALDVVMTTHKQHVDQLEQTDNEQLFITVKTSKSVTKDGDMLLHAMTTDWRERGIRYFINETLDNRVLEMKSFGRFEEDCVVKEYTATFQRNINVKRSTDSKDVQVNDLCLMESGELILTDNENKKLKRFNSDLQFKDEVILSDNPVAVCKIDKQEVAVRLNCTRVLQFVSVDQSMRLKSSFTLTDLGHGMTYDSSTGEIFSCEGNKVIVYSKGGNKLRMYEKNTSGEPLFGRCRHITLSANKQDIYVTDFIKGLVVIDKSGYLKIKASTTGITQMRPLCLLPGHICLVGSWSSCVIVQIDEYGNQVGKLINTNDGRTYTYCAVYDSKHSRLIVGGYPNVISTYKIFDK